jgi:hypothetical protein
MKIRQGVNEPCLARSISAPLHAVRTDSDSLLSPATRDCIGAATIAPRSSAWKIINIDIKAG